jgi:hypothetical protein
MAQTWREKHPDWEYRLWTDDDLERLVTDFYPHFLEQFLSYPNPVQRADAGRYLVLHRHGGALFRHRYDLPVSFRLADRREPHRFCTGTERA